MNAARAWLAGLWWRLHAERPEFWTIGLAVIGWLVLVRGWLTETPMACHAASVWQTGVHWLAMVAAMMLPAMLGQVRFVAGHSLWRLRHRHIACFLGGYATVWMLWGLVSEGGLRLLGGGGEVLAGSAIAAAAWQVSPWKEQGRRDCHRGALLAVRGWRAAWDCVRYGASVGVACWFSCWALMLICSAAGHSPWAMAGVTALVWLERQPERTPDHRTGLARWLPRAG